MLEDRPLLPYRSVLIVQTAFPGDVVLCTPMVRATRKSFAEAAITFLSTPVAANLLETNPHIDELVTYDKRGEEAGVAAFARLVRRLRRRRFDLALLPHRSLRTALLAWAAGIPVRVGFAVFPGGPFYTHRVVYDRTQHEIERNLALLQAIGGTADGLQPEVFPDAGDRTRVDQLLEGVDQRAPLLAIAPGSIWPTKRWTPHGFAEVGVLAVEKLGATVMVVGGSEDRPLAQDVVAAIGKGAINAAGKLSFRQSAELIRRCRVLVCNDSAPLHLGVAMGTHTVAIFGPTVTSFGFGPIGQGHAVVQKELLCRPCGIHGGRKCPIGTHECMTAIRATEVFEQVRALWQEAAPPRDREACGVQCN
ncbi:MAG: glycosyltransferase family 9 protein [candidate division KSB1 bacterium]|nr:glycosyltransferase family 9 protein [candidate division KSB1 bacterium]